MDDFAIKVNNLTKTYPLYEDKKDRMKEALSLRKKKRHREFHALKNVSFEVKKGETLGIIGTNGSGKSTLLKIITGVLTQTSGDIRAVGKISALLELGAGFNPEMTGMENIYLNGTIMGYTTAETEERVPKITEFADIGDFINSPVKMYSSGMFARLAFAVAINTDPDILIVDEALSVGDVFYQNKCFHKMEEIKKSGTTILFVSHDMVSVKRLCNKVLWLENGAVEGFGEKRDICEKYMNRLIETNGVLSESALRNTGTDKFSECIFAHSKAQFPNNAAPGDNDMVSNRIKLLSFFVRDDSGKITNALKTQKVYSFHMVAQSKEDIENVIFGFTVEDGRGMNIISFNTFLRSGERVIDVSKDYVYEIVFTVDLPRIHEGEYLISPAIATGNQDAHLTLSWLHNKELITVENDGYNLSLLEIPSDMKIIAHKSENVTLNL